MRLALTLGVIVILLGSAASVYLTRVLESAPITVENPIEISQVPAPESVLPSVDATSTPTTTPAQLPETAPKVPAPVTADTPAPSHVASQSSDPPPVVPIAPTPPTPRPSADEGAALARAALVNITCASDHPYVGKATGSGVIVDPKGIIVTNAHVAQLFLIEAQSTNTDCFVRTGSPAQPAYEAELIFISQQWLARHSLTFNQDFKAVNGDYDYAFLAITGTKTDTSLPESFSYVPLSEVAPKTGEQIVAAGYAAELLTESQIDTSLFPTIAIGTVGTTSSFSGGTTDAIDMRGTAAAQSGSSGGGIVSPTGDLLGVITLRTGQKSTGDRSFTAITSPYIRRMYAQESGQSLETLFKKPLRESVEAYRSRIPALARPLLSNINLPNFYYFIDCDVVVCPTE